MLCMRFALFVVSCTAACGFPRPVHINDDAGGGISDSAHDDATVGGSIDGSPVDAVPLTPASSCVALPHTCGASSAEDCCASLPVSGGTYLRWYDEGADGAGYSRAGFAATVSDFRLDKYEVTVSRFRAFVEEQPATQSNPPTVGSGANPYLAGTGWQAAWNANLPMDKADLLANIACDAMLQTWTDRPGPFENRPMNCLSWYEAIAFCAWDGGFLPTEAEWNYAAASGSEQRAFPWSSPPSSVEIGNSRASYQDDATGCVGDGYPACTRDDLLPVGSRPEGDGRWGQSDLAGNVAEWVLDWETEDPVPPITPCFDCANLVPLHPSASGRVLRGDSFFGKGVSLRTSWPSVGFPDEHTNSPYRGVRCARAP
jgi:sulfatase modifying factor 1